MTVLDSTGVIDYLLGTGSAGAVEPLLDSPSGASAPDLIVFEALAVLRRHSHSGALAPERARAAVEDLGDLPLELFPTLPLRHRAWELRDNMTAADALFVALAELLEEPLATGDARLAKAARSHTSIEVVELGPS